MQRKYSSLCSLTQTFISMPSHIFSYLTHLNHNAAPEEMIGRFYSNRKLALSLIPAMKHNLEHRFKNLDPNNFRIEMQALKWYESRGWKLWLF